jgi:hypothetical protein
VKRTLRFLAIVFVFPFVLQCDSDSPVAIRNFDLTGDWSVHQGSSVSWSCSGQLQSAGPSLCWTGFFATLEQDGGRFHAVAFPDPGVVIGPTLCEPLEFSGRVTGTDVAGVLRYEGSAGPLTVTPGIVRVELEGAIDESGEYPVVTLQPTRVTVEEADGECQMSVTFTIIPAGEVLVTRP